MKSMQESTRRWPSIALAPQGSRLKTAAPRLVSTWLLWVGGTSLPTIPSLIECQIAGVPISAHDILGLAQRHHARAHFRVQSVLDRVLLPCSRRLVRFRPEIRFIARVPSEFKRNQVVFLAVAPSSRTGAGAIPTRPPIAGQLPSLPDAERTTRSRTVFTRRNIIPLCTRGRAKLFRWRASLATNWLNTSKVRVAWES